MALVVDDLMMTAAMADQLERELDLPKGSIARNRVLSEAEQLFYKIPEATKTILALHVERFRGSSALVVFELGDEDDKQKPHLEGAPIRDARDRQALVEAHWGALTIARQSGLMDSLGQPLAIMFTSWADAGAEGGGGNRYSWSVTPQMIQGIYSDAPRCVLAEPVLSKIEATEDGEPSPGLEISSLKISSVIFVHSILFQGATALQNHDAMGLVEEAHARRREWEIQREAAGAGLH